MSRGYKICSRCVMDTSDPAIAFDPSGVCNHCRAYDELARRRLSPGNGESPALGPHLAEIKAAGRGRTYDCILGVSGGVDSTYALVRAVDLGLRPLAVHFDCGWDSEVAVKNIESLLKALGVDLFTHVVAWEEMRDLQLAFLKASVANCDIPTDHAIFAALYSIASEQRIKWIVTGSNIVTEAVLPLAWGYNSADLRHLRAVHRAHGTRPLLHYPQLGFLERFVWYPYVRRIRIFRLLDHLPYVKSDAMRMLEDRFGWRYYGGKHYESRFTKFFQAYYLPRKFGYDKRRAHMSALICSGQTDRATALAELEHPPCSEKEGREMVEYVSKKLGISAEELEAIVASPPKSHDDYASDEWLIRVAYEARAILDRLRGPRR